jgi:hypothetical protein
MMYAVKGIYEMKKGIVQPEWDVSPVNCDYNVIITFVDPASDGVSIEHGKESAAPEVVRRELKPGITPATSRDTSWLDHPWHVEGDASPMTREEMYDRL